MKYTPLLLTILTALSASALEFPGARVVSVAPEAASGLEGIYVLENTAGVRAVYHTSAPSAVKWYRFSNLGGAYAEEIASAAGEGGSYITLGSGDFGYIIEADGRQHCFWVTDYSGHEFRATALTVDPEQDCDRLRLDFEGSAAEIACYTINGRRMAISRDITVEHNTLAFDQESFTYTQATATENIEYIDGTSVAVAAPLCATVYTLEGDRFLRAWGRAQQVSTATVQPTAVSAETRAVQDTRENENEQKEPGNEGLGGSAPVDITFDAVVTDAAIFHEWQISRMPEFDINELTYTDLSFTFSFREQGRTYVRFVAADAAGVCEYVSPVYEVFVGESKLEIPNAFSPESSPGVNDEWKVSYKSLVSYECHIFNRWGQQLFESTDPAQGWDGRHGGRFVPAGVYYYVITATGADGVEYKRAGDINIVGYSTGNRGTTEE